MATQFFQSTVSLVLTLGFVASSAAAEPDFYKDVYPFLKTNCIACHNKTTTKAGLNMETPALMKEGGDSGPSIIEGKSEQSLIVEASAHTFDLEMPPANNKSDAQDLTKSELEILKKWIDLGAKDSVREERQVTWKPLAPGTYPIYTVTMTADGRYAACARGADIFVYDLATHQIVETLSEAHRAPVHALAFSPDGKQLASSSYREVKLWERKAPPREAVVATTDLETVARILDFAPSDIRLLQVRNSLAAITTDTQISLWDLESGEARFRAEASHLVAIGVHDDGIVSLGKNKEVHFWTSVDSGKLCTLPYPAVAIALSADADQLATGDGNGIVRIWDAATGKEQLRLMGDDASSKSIAALEWTMARQTLEQAHQKSAAALAVARNKALDDLIKKATDAIAAMKKSLPKKEAAVPPAKEATLAAQTTVKEAQTALEASPKDAKLQKALVTAKDKLITAQAKENSALTTFESTSNNIADDEQKVEKMTASKTANDQEIAETQAAEKIASETIAKVKAQLAEEKKAITLPKAATTSITFSTDGHSVHVQFKDQTECHYAIATGFPITGGSRSPTWQISHTLTEGFTDRVNALAFSPDSKTLATGGGESSRSGDILLFDAQTGKSLATWMDRHDDSVVSLDFSPNGKHIASGAADKIAHITEVATGEPVNLLEAHTHYVMDVAFRADGRVLATAGADGIVNTWNLAHGERIKKIDGWKKEVTSLQFIGATNQIITSAGDNRIRIVRDDGGQVRTIDQLPDFMQATASTSDGKILIGGGEDSYLRVWNGKDGKEIIAFAP